MGSIVEDKKKYFLSISFFAVLIIVTFLIIFNDKDMLNILPQMLAANPLWICAGFAAMFGFVFCEALNIYHLTTVFGEKTTLRSCLKYAFIGFYFSSITPSSSGGQPAQIYYMKKDSMKVGTSTLSFMIMLASLQCVTLVLGIMMLLTKGAFVFANMNGIWVLFIYGTAFYIFLIAVLLCAIFSATMLEKLAVGAVSFLGRIKLIKNKELLTQKTVEMVKNYVACASNIKKDPSALFTTMLISTCQILCQFSIPYFIYKAFGQSAYGYMDVFALQTILTICVSSLPLPGAVGASEGSFLKMFYVIFGSELVLPAMLLNRTVSFYSFLVLSGIISAAVHFKSLKKHKA